MTTPPPPPPPSSGPAWPSSGGATGPTSSGSGGEERASWWSTGRIIGAIAVVLVLMGGSAGAGFVVGLGVGGATSFAGGAGGISFDGEMFEDGFFEGEMSEDMFEDGFGSDVPGMFGSDSEVLEEGPLLSSGARAAGQVGDGPTEHLLTVGGGRTVIEVIEADFDTVLVLLDQDGTVIASDDDGGEPPLSRIEIDLDEGSYLVRVQPWASGGGGYTVAVD